MSQASMLMATWLDNANHTQYGSLTLVYRIWELRCCCVEHEPPIHFCSSVLIHMWGDQKLIENYQLACHDWLLETFFSIQSYGLGLEAFAREQLLFAYACFGQSLLSKRDSTFSWSTQPFHILLLWFFKHSFLLHVLMFCFLEAFGID